MKPKVKVRFSGKTAAKTARGEYQVSLKFAADSSDGRLTDGQEQIALTVTRRRFSLFPEEVYSVYPPRESCGAYALHLPHVVFERSSLPWEYSESREPSLALFLSADGEGTVKKELPVKEILTADKRTFVSDRLARKKCDADPEDAVCTVIDLKASLFNSLRVSPEERELLTHVREVSLDDKVTDPTVKNGAFSVLIGNRFPEEPENPEAQPKKHEVYVVSMAEYDGLAIPEGIDFVRCLCLYHWNFSVNFDSCGFSEAVEQLTTGSLVREVSKQVREEPLKDILERGYLPLNHDLRDGGRTVSWYRGPLIPYEECVENRPYSVFSDELYYYDPNIGMMDVSYACAWQIGRMIAMNYSTVTNEIVRWRHENYLKAALQRQKKELKERLPVQADTLEEAVRASVLAAADQVPEY